MSLNRSRTTRNRTFAHVLETDTGTYVAPTGADAAFIAMDPSIVYDKNIEVITAQGSAAPSRSVPGVSTAAVKVGTYLMNTGVAATLNKCMELLACSGFKGTGTNLKTFLPLGATDAGNTGTAGMWEDGTLKTASGCAYKWKITGETAKPVKIEFDGKGIRKSAPADATQVFGAAPANLPPLLVSAAFTIGGTTICVPGFEIDGGGEVELRPCANDVTGYLAAQFFPSVTKMKIAPDAKLLAEINWYTKFSGAVESAFTVTIGTLTDNKVVITAPAIQLTGDPERQDASGAARDALEFQFNAVTGNDQIQIAFL
jgi:hypothetical protein